MRKMSNLNSAKDKTILSDQASYSCIISNGGCVVLFSHFYVSDMATQEVPAVGPSLFNYHYIDSYVVILPIIFT